MNWVRILWIALSLIALGCGGPAGVSDTLTLGTTTSAQDSGLLDVLVPMFRQQTGIEVKVVAVGTGQALELGRRGDADVLLVHDPAAEEKFMAEGHGALRRALMHNDFILVGMELDPAKVKGEKSIVEAFKRIASSQSTFVSRGDESGTHQKERQIWKEANIKPQGSRYVSAGAGMGQVLHMASEKRAYTFTDRGTFLAQRQGLDLAIMSEGDPLLLNYYHVIVVNPEKHPHIHDRAARRFVDFLLSSEGQKTISTFGVDRYGQPLFFVEQPEMEKK